MPSAHGSTIEVAVYQGQPDPYATVIDTTLAASALLAPYQDHASN